MIIVDPSCDYLVGLNELNYSFSIYPNPTNDILHLKLEDNLIEWVEIFDNSGKIVLRKTSSNLNEDYVDVSHLVIGFYRIRIKGAESIFHSSFIKQ